MIAAIIYAKFSPFHDARLRVAGELGNVRGHRLVGIEIAGTHSDYRWQTVAGTINEYTHVTLFPTRDRWSLTYREVRAALHQLLNEVKPDVVFLPGWGFRESVVGLGWSLRQSVPTVVISDSQSIDTPPDRLKWWGKRMIVSRFQAGFAAGKSSLEYLINLGIPRSLCFVGCDVVDNSFFSQDHNSDSRKFQATPTLLSCIRLLPRKNLLSVIDVLQEQAKTWKWIIAGDGPQRAELSERVRVLGLEPRVKLLGHVDYFSLPKVYAQADVYLQPSLSEPWGLAVNEAMASGLPVAVSNRCGCHADLVQEGINGFTFDPVKAGSLAEALNRLLECRERWQEMGRASRQIIAGWNLDLFANNFWRAAEAAVQSMNDSLPARLWNKTLSTIL